MNSGSLFRVQRSTGALSLIVVMCLVFAIIGVGVALFPMWSATLIVGAPCVVLVLSRNTRQTGMLGILSLAPIVAVVKAFTGVRYAPVILDVALLLLVVFSMLDQVMQHSLRLGRLHILVLAYIALYALQMFNSNAPPLEMAFEGFRYAAFQALGFFAGVYMLRTSRRIKGMMLVVCTSSALVALYAIKQYFWPSWIDQQILNNLPEITSYLTAADPATLRVRAFSTLSGPFHLSLFMVLAILLTVSLLMRRGRHTSILLLLILLQVSALLLSIVRTGWIAALAGLGVYTLLLAARGKITSSARIGIFVCIALLLLGLFLSEFANPSAVSYYFFSLTAPTGNTNLVGRVQDWVDNVMPAIARSPLLGYGTGSALDSLWYRLHGNIHFITHNGFLKVAIETGTLGLFGFLAIILVGLKDGFKTYLELEDEFLKMTATWALSFAAAMLVGNMGVPALDTYPASLYFWILLGVLTNLREIETEEKRYAQN